MKAKDIKDFDQDLFDLACSYEIVVTIRSEFTDDNMPWFQCDLETPADGDAHGEAASAVDAIDDAIHSFKSRKGESASLP